MSEELLFRLGVELAGSEVVLLVHTRSDGQEVSTTRLPINAAIARQLASQLIGAAAAADPAGHQAMLADIAKLFGDAVTLAVIPITSVH